MRRVMMLLVLFITVISLNSEVISVNGNQTGVLVTSQNSETIDFEYTAGSFTAMTTEIDGNSWNQVILPEESMLMDAGYPSLPQLKRSVIIGNDSSIDVAVKSFEYEEFDLDVLPSKGTLLRNIDPASVAYEFGQIYSEDRFWPEERVSVSEPYIFRDFRGVDISIVPFSYNGVTGNLRFYTNIEFEIRQSSGGTVNVKLEETEKVFSQFDALYKRHFINYPLDRYVTLEETAGRMLIISYGDFIEEMQPFVDWKNQKGIATEIIDVSSIGNNSTSIQNAIDSEYADGDLVWVLLVGDNLQVATKTYSGAGGDPQYSYITGSDYYSEIFVGRFSAENTTHVATQVERSIYYERDVIDGDWMQRGMGVASSQGSGSGHYGEADYVHIGYIRDDLLDYGYFEIDEIYATNGGNASDVANALNEGRGIVNYCGHGSTTSWSTTGFNNTYVNALTNDYMLPFIFSVACVNGNFTSTTCFAEAWMRAMNGDAPTGAVSIFASSINQSWAPPMYAQDEAIDLMCAEELSTIGGLWFNGVSYMIEESNDTAMARTWHIFGDPSLQVRSKTPSAMNATYSPSIQNMQESYTVDAGIEGALACLSYEGEMLASAYSQSDGIATLFPENLPEEPVTLTLTITAYNKVTEIGEVELIFDGGAYVQMMGYELLSGADDEINPSDSALLSISLFNVGTEASEEIALTLFCESEFIELVDNTETASSIPVGGNATLENCFSFNVADELLNGAPVTFDIEAVSGENIWNYSIGEFGIAQEGIIGLTEEIEIDLDLGETTDSELILKNNNYEGEIEYTIFINETTGSRDLTGSTITCDAFDFTPGETANWTFTCENNSPDYEWITDIDITFPNGVTVNDAGDFVGGSDDLEFEGGTGNGATCTWHGESSNGWGVIHHGESASATVNLTISSGFMGDIDVDWVITGDGYGGGSHTIDGIINISSNGEPVTWITIEELSGSLTGGETGLHSIAFDTNGLDAGVYTAEINVTADESTTIIPVTLNAGMNYIAYGDVDDNGFVESFDSSVLLQAMVGISPAVAPLPWEEWRILRGDVDGDEELSAYDASLILQYVVGIISEFPAETGRDHEYPVGDIDLRLRSENGISWLDFYAQGDVYGFRMALKSHDVNFGAPVFAEGIQSSWNFENGLNMAATASAEAYDTVERFMSLPIETVEEAGIQTIFMDINGSEAEKSIYIESTGSEIPQASVITSNYPNPFNPETTIEYALSEDSAVELDVYNIRGQKILTLVCEDQSRGSHQVVWNGKDSDGETVSSGTYICRLRSSSGTAMRKLVLMK